MCKVIGIDISKASFDIAFQKGNGNFTHLKFTNNKRGFEGFRTVLAHQDHCIMEASGPYYLFLAHYLVEHKIKVSVVNPLQIKHFVRMRMIKAKTDKKDAQMIALYGQNECPSLWHPDQDQIIQLQQINAAVEGLRKQVSMVNNQLQSFCLVPGKDPEVIKTLKSLLKTLKTKITKLEDRMREIAEKHFSNTYEALLSIPGIGNKTAILLIAVTNNFTKFQSSKKLSAFVGLAPRIYESGSSVKGRGHITKMGNKHLRKLLYMCAWTAKRNNNHCKLMYERLAQKGKPEKVIKVAIANKLLRQAFAIGSNAIEYQNNYEKKFAF